MADKTVLIKPVAALCGVALVSSLAAGTVLADDPFELTDLDTGYMLAGDDKGEEGKCGEGKCGEEGEEGDEGEDDGDEDEDKGEEGKCGEGKCGS